MNTIIARVRKALGLSLTAKSEAERDYITLGSRKKHVLNILGTPKNVVGNRWIYHAGSIQFDTFSGRVVRVRPNVHESSMHFRIDPESLC